MKKVVVIVFALLMGATQAQNKVKPTFEKEGNLVKATYYYADGSIHRQGFYENKKLEGQWVEYDQKGNKTRIAYYTKGVKTGTWYQFKDDLRRKIVYKKNKVVSVGSWEEDSSKIVSN